MPHPISIATIASIGYLGGLFTMQAGRGLIMAFLVFASWVWFFAKGADFNVIWQYRLLVDYFFPTLLFSFVGAMICVIFRFHPIMDGLHLRDLYTDEYTGKVSYSAIGRILVLIIVVLLFFFGAHLALEIQSPSWPRVWAGVTCSLGIAAGWAVFYFAFRREFLLFHPAAVEPGTKDRRSFWKAEIINYVIIGFVGHFSFVTAYWIWQLVFGDDILWITSNWSFWASLILAGAILVIMYIVSFFVRPGDHDPGYKTVNPEEPVLPESTPPPPPAQAAGGAFPMHLLKAAGFSNPAPYHGSKAY